MTSVRVAAIAILMPSSFVLSRTREETTANNPTLVSTVASPAKATRDSLSVDEALAEFR